MEEDDRDNPLAIEMLLALGSELDPQDFEGRTPLHVAVLHDNINIAKCLLGHGAAANIEDNDGNTALHLAAFHEEKEASDYHSPLYAKRLLIVEALIDFGAYVNAQNSSNQTPLMKAVIEGHLGIVNCLLNFEADADLQDNDGNTALHLAVCHEKEDGISLLIVHSLLENGSNVDAVNNRSETPLLMAVRGWHFGIVKELLEWHPFVAQSNENGQSCLHILYEGAPGKTYLMIQLVKAGAPIQSVDKRGQAPVHYILQRKAPHWVNIEEAKEFIKMASLVNNEEKINFLISGELETHADECYAEIVRMRSISCGTTYNLLDFCLRGREVANGDSNEEKVVLKSAFQAMVRETFLIYNDCQQSHFQRSYLLGKLMEKSIYVKNDLTYTEFPSCLIPDLCSFLSKEDLFNVLRV